MTAVGEFLGRHVIAEFEGVDSHRLDDEDLLCTLLTDSVTRAGATVLDIASKRFVPQGVTVVLLLSESHASIHTYPEIGAAFVDVFTCGERADPAYAVRHVIEALEPDAVRMSTIRRGQGGRTSALTGVELCEQIVHGAEEPEPAGK
ncbi:adenosylmethionine decarboxylase [Nocardia sp. NPDC051990]|uniref:adenosylmethionine decarboxylase n=1 Tax=Nocardia sp. NPDC051990 TaxID=3155285 RepID=UPI00344045F8